MQVGTLVLRIVREALVLKNHACGLTFRWAAAYLGFHQPEN